MPPDNPVEKIRRTPLDAKGVCTKCNCKADAECMQCFGCNEYFHVINCPPGTKQNQVTKTFFDGWDNMMRHYKNIQYICDACHQDKKFKNEIIVSNRMCVMEEEISDVKKQVNQGFNEIRDMIKNMSQSSASSSQSSSVPLNIPDGPAWSDIVTGKATSKSTSSVVVIKKKKNGPPADINQVREAAISTNAAISKTYHNNSGDTVVVLENNTSKEAILPVLEREIDQDCFSVVPIKERLPTITIVNIDQEYNKERLLELVKNQNTARFGDLDVNEENFKIIYMKKQFKNPDLFKAIVRVSCEIRSALEKSGDHINIGLSSCAVFDDFFIRRCNKCQGFNHWKNECHNDIPVMCGKCGEKHDTRSCKSSVTKCCNCMRAGFTDINHEASSLQCQAYKEAQKRLHDTINYYKDNPKNIKGPSR